MPERERGGRDSEIERRERERERRERDREIERRERERERGLFSCRFQRGKLSQTL